MNPYSTHHINNPLFTVFPLTNQQVPITHFRENAKEQFLQLKNSGGKKKTLIPAKEVGFSNQELKWTERFVVLADFTNKSTGLNLI
jgi:hypothetical protein